MGSVSCLIGLINEMKDTFCSTKINEGSDEETKRAIKIHISLIDLKMIYVFQKCYRIMYNYRFEYSLKSSLFSSK